MLQWLKRRYIPYLLLYVAILFIVVFLVLFGIFKLLPSEGVFSLDVIQPEDQNDIALPNASDFYLEFFNYAIDFGFYPIGSGYYHDRYKFLLQFPDTDGLILVGDTDEQIDWEPDFYIEITTDYSFAIRYLNADEETSETHKGSETSLPFPFLSLSLWDIHNFNPTISVHSSQFLNRTDINYSDYSFHFLCVNVDVDCDDIPMSIAELSIKGNTVIEFGSDAYACFYSGSGEKNRIKKLIIPESISEVGLIVDSDSHYGSHSNPDPNTKVKLMFSTKYPFQRDYHLNAHFTGDTVISGDGTLFYSSYTSDKEYPLHMQSIQVKDADANLSILSEANNTSVKLNGSATDVLRSSVSLKPSIINWISENVAVFPTFLLTVFGGAITISLKMWDKENAKPSAAKPEACHCEPAPQRWRGNPYSRRPASIYARRKAKEDREKRIVTSADASSQ